LREEGVNLITDNTKAVLASLACPGEPPDQHLSGNKTHNGVERSLARAGGYIVHLFLFQVIVNRKCAEEQEKNTYISRKLSRNPEKLCRDL
jgi:hypothetical protein